MRHFKLDTACKWDLCDDDMEELAFAWPDLRTLLLDPTNQWSLPHRITLRSLATLAALCPHVETLGLVLDTSTTDPNELNYDVQNNACETLYVGDSEITKDALRDVCDFLTAVYPNVDAVHVVQRPCPGDDGYKTGWQIVQAWLLTMASMRRSGRGHHFGRYMN